VERRSPAHLALIASGAAVLLAVGVLLVEIRSGAGESGVPAPAGERRLPAVARATLRAEREPLFGGHPEGHAAARSAQAPLDGPSGAPTPSGVATAQQQGAMAEAIALFDRGEYEAARTAAVTAIGLNVDPMGLDRMQSIATTASCYLGDADQARVWYARLVPTSRPVIAARCRGLGIEL
jgi:hypothetical protein